MTEAELAADIATEAGKLLRAIQQSGLSGRELCNAGDLQANNYILARLRAERPGVPVFSEESLDDPVRLTSDRVWIIDPLDGTREFGEGRNDWAVHVALAIDGAPAIGAVALPGLGITLSSDNPPPLPAPHDPPRMLVSRTRPSDLCEGVSKLLGARTVGMGSAGAKAMAVVRGEAEIYLHSGGQHQWDNCAPAAVALAAGLHVSRIDGSDIVYNQQSSSIPDLLICRKEAAPRLLALIAETCAA